MRHPRWSGCRTCSIDTPPSSVAASTKRVGLARALVFGPKLLLLDEPLSGLDAALRRQTRVELEQLQDRVKVTTIYVTHDQEEAMSVSDLVVVMSEGRVVAIAPPSEIYDRPDSVFVASFVGASNLLSGRVIALKADSATIRLADGSVISGVCRKQMAVGDEAVAAIKPVDVVVRADDGTGDNLVAASVVSATYLGPQIELLLTVASNEFRVSIQRWSMLGTGDSVRLQLPPERVTVLPPD